MSIAGKDEYPQTLIIEPGQTLEGRFERLERGTTKDGEPRAIAIMTIDGAERSLWLHETALRAKFSELRPEPGELVAIHKGAEKRTSETSGRSYWPFRVAAPDRTVQAPSWDDPLFAGDDIAPVPSDVPSDIPKGDDDDTPF